VTAAAARALFATILGDWRRACAVDLYTKTILTLIALFLAVIALRPIVQPAPALAQANLGGVQFSASDQFIAFFDPRSGDVWQYSNSGLMNVYHYKLTKLGTPLGK
jgi:hypothetical protein